MILQRVLETAAKVDVDLSYKLFRSVPRTQKLLQILKGLEWSCHGIPWLAGTVTLIYINPEWTALKYLLVGLIMDLVYVATLKAWARRRRPVFAGQNDQMVLVSVDKHSFPSGHTSRAFYLACFCYDQSFWSLMVCVWAASVALSRVLLGRHHIGDILAGIILGFLEYTIQFSMGLPLNNIILWIVSSGLGKQFHTSNDQPDGEILGPLD